MSLSVNIEKSLGDFRLRVAFETSGALLALLGASGSGKSVSLRCIAGLMRPDRGRIVLNGENDPTILYNNWWPRSGGGGTAPWNPGGYDNQRGPRRI